MADGHSDKLFRTHQQALEHEPCPQCGSQSSGELAIRHGKHGPFLGCSRYPACDYIKPLHQNDGHLVKELGVPCPMCSEELVLRQGRYGMFIGCSAYPECSHIESLDQPSQSKSKAEEACPECGSGHLVERQSRFGKQFFACDNYPKCKFAVNHPPINGRCEVCRYPLLVIKKAASDDSPAKHQCAARKCQHIQGE